MTEVQRVRVRRAAARRRWDNEWLDLVVAMAISIALLVPTGLLSLPPTVDRLTISNPTVYDIHVAVGDGDGSWMPVITVGHGNTATTADVIDQGDVWEFRFRGQGRAGGELTISRDDLETAGWRLTIPAEVGEQLAELGAPPPP